MAQCGECRQWFHAACCAEAIPAATFLPYQLNYAFTCAECSPGSAEFALTKASWVQRIQMVLALQAARSDASGERRWAFTIKSCCEVMAEHWSVVCYEPGGAKPVSGYSVHADGRLVADSDESKSLYKVTKLNSYFTNHATSHMPRGGSARRAGNKNGKPQLFEPQLFEPELEGNAESGTPTGSWSLADGTLRGPVPLAGGGGGGAAQRAGGSVRANAPPAVAVVAAVVVDGSAAPGGSDNNEPPPPTTPWHSPGGGARGGAAGGPKPSWVPAAGGRAASPASPADEAAAPGEWHGVASSGGQQWAVAPGESFAGDDVLRIWVCQRCYNANDLTKTGTTCGNEHCERDGAGRDWGGGAGVIGEDLLVEDWSQLADALAISEPFDASFFN